MARDALRALSREMPNSRHRIQIIVETETESDRVAAILSATMLEDALKEAISQFMRPSLSDKDYSSAFDGMGFLSSFSAKITAGYVFGLYGCHTRSDLNIIKDIRNAFAHASIPIDFNTDSIRNACAQLHVCSTISDCAFTPWPPVEPRQVYVRSSHYIALHLQKYVEKREVNENPHSP